MSVGSAPSQTGYVVSQCALCALTVCNGVYSYSAVTESFSLIFLAYTTIEVKLKLKFQKRKSTRSRAVTSCLSRPPADKILHNRFGFRALVLVIAKFNLTSRNSFQLREDDFNLDTFTSEFIPTSRNSFQLREHGFNLDTSTSEFIPTSQNSFQFREHGFNLDTSTSTLLHTLQLCQIPSNFVDPTSTSRSISPKRLQLHNSAVSGVASILFTTNIVVQVQKPPPYAVGYARGRSNRS